MLGLTPGTLRAYHERGKITAKDSGGRGFALMFTREALGRGSRRARRPRRSDARHDLPLDPTSSPQDQGPGVVRSREYRHTVSTAAGNQGAADEAISKALGHKTATTTKRHYITRQVPPKIPTFA